MPTFGGIMHYFCGLTHESKAEPRSQAHPCRAACPKDSMCCSSSGRVAAWATDSRAWFLSCRLYCAVRRKRSHVFRLSFARTRVCHSRNHAAPENNWTQLQSFWQIAFQDFSGRHLPVDRALKRHHSSDSESSERRVSTGWYRRACTLSRACCQSWRI